MTTKWGDVAIEYVVKLSMIPRVYTGQFSGQERKERLFTNYVEAVLFVHALRSMTTTDLFPLTGDNADLIVYDSIIYQRRTTISEVPIGMVGPAGQVHNTPLGRKKPDEPY